MKGAYSCGWDDPHQVNHKNSSCFSPLSKRIALLSTGSALKSPDELGVLVGIFHCIEQRLKFGIDDLWDYKVERGTGRGSCTLV